MFKKGYINFPDRVVDLIFINDKTYIEYDSVKTENIFQKPYGLSRIDISNNIYEIYPNDKLLHINCMKKDIKKKNPWLNLTTNYNNVKLWNNVSFNHNNIPTVTIRNKNNILYPITILHYGLEILNNLILEKNNSNSEDIIVLKRILNYIQNSNLTNTFTYSIGYKRNNKILPELNKSLSENTIDCMTIGLYLSFISKYNIYFNETNNYNPIIKEYIPLLTTKIFNLTIFDSYYDLNTNKGCNLILNHHLYFLVGCHDYYLYSNEDYFKKLFYDNIEDTINLLPLFDLGNWSSYDLSHIVYKTDIRRCNSNYHFVHIKLLNYLYIVTKDSTIKFYVDKFTKYLNRIY